MSATFFDTAFLKSVSGTIIIHRIPAAWRRRRCRGITNPPGPGLPHATDPFSEDLSLETSMQSSLAGSIFGMYG